MFLPCTISTLHTIPLPLQMAGSIFLDKQAPSLSIFCCLLLWPRPSALHSCGRLLSPASFRCNPSLRTFILMQLPAVRSALTASRWVTPCMLKPLTCEGGGSHYTYIGESRTQCVEAQKHWLSENSGLFVEEFILFYLVYPLEVIWPNKKKKIAKCEWKVEEVEEFTLI